MESYNKWQDMIFDKILLDDLDDELNIHENSDYKKELRMANDPLDEEVLKKPVDLRILSLGAGVQSSTLLMKIYNGVIKPVDYAIFADTGNEPQEVYDWFEFITDKVKDKIKILIVNNDRNTGDITKDLLSSEGFHASIPVHVKNANGKKGMTLRTCTDRYKIQPINKKIREILGVKTLRGQLVEIVMGISLDEIQRVKRPPNKWAINTYPLIEQRITREMCLDYFKELGLPQPPKSACIICPYHDNTEWLRIKENNPKEFESAIEFDKQLREKKDSTFVSKLDGELYLHPKLIPLDQVNLRERKDYQFSLFDDECDGYCGV